VNRKGNQKTGMQMRYLGFRREEDGGKRHRQGGKKGTQIGRDGGIGCALDVSPLRTKKPGMEKGKVFKLGTTPMRFAQVRGWV